METDYMSINKLLTDSGLSQYKEEVAKKAPLLLQEEPTCEERIKTIKIESDLIKEFIKKTNFVPTDFTNNDWDPNCLEFLDDIIYYGVEKNYIYLKILLVVKYLMSFSFLPALLQQIGPVDCGYNLITSTYFNLDLI